MLTRCKNVQICLVTAVHFCSDGLQSVCDCRYNILVYLLTFVLSWMLFALLWWVMQSWHGGETCVEGVSGFTTAVLFSIETQHTIGYGSRAVTDRCTGAVTLLMFQSVFGAITQCVITGIIFAKVYSPMLT